MHSLEILAKGLQRLRRERGLTQEALAERVDISMQFLAAIEQAKKAPSFDTLDALCEALDLSPSQLFAAGEEPRTAPKGASTKLTNAIAALPRAHDEEMTEVVYAISRMLSSKSKGQASSTRRKGK